MNSVEIRVSEEKDVLRLRFAGELDHHAAGEAMLRAEEILDRRLPRDCVLDLSSLRFMDSSGVALILRLHKHMRDAGGRLRVEDPAEQPLRVLDVSGIDRLVRICTTGKEQRK